MATTSYIGKGTVYVQAGSNSLVSVGNVSKLSVSIDEDRQEMLDYENAGGGVADSVSRIKSMTLDMTAHSFSAENLNMALRGTSAAVTAGAIVDEAVVADKGGLNILAKLPNPDVAMTVEGGVGDSTTFTEGTDYVRTRSGFTIPSTSTIVDADTLVVGYTSLAGDALEGLVSGATSVRVVFEGLNEARSGKAVVVEAFKVQFSPSKGIDFISDKFGELQLSGLVLKDETKTTSGKSQYITVRTAN